MMRSLPGDIAYSNRSRSGSLVENDATPLTARGHHSQTSYFLANEETVETDQSQNLSGLRGRSTMKDSTFGIQSMESRTSSISHGSGGEDEYHAKQMNRRNRLVADDSENQSPRLFSDLRERSPYYYHDRNFPHATISRPYTPISLGSPAPPSLLSSPCSQGPSGGSDADESASQVIKSSGDQEYGTGLGDSGSAPQLIMPSIKMPSRRPFTEKGKHMGRLKILIAGDTGVGKTSLVKAIVQSCEDIVHVDPFNASTSIPEPRRRSKSKRGSVAQSTAQITEIYASTRVYPAWWSDIEESRILRRRKSLGDSVLERNLCFVDTPGYGTESSCLESMKLVLDYIENHLRKVLDIDSLGESDIINMLGGNGGSQVDVVFYIISPCIKPIDLEYMRQISALTNFIPLIARSDMLSFEEISASKLKIMSELDSADIRSFLFGPITEDISSTIRPPFAVSTFPAKDDETMDASLLMSPDYVSPLIPSELAALVSRIFDHDNISWLRHSAAKKLIQWRDSTKFVSKSQVLYRPLLSSSKVLTGPVGATTSFALARITDHTQREERLAQVRLSNWAAELQRTLHNERAKFESIAHSERVAWLTERLGECVQDGGLVPNSQALPEPQVSATSCTLIKEDRSESTLNGHYGNLSNVDPLGILALNATIRKNLKIAFGALTGIGVIATMVFWVSDSATVRDIGRAIRDFKDGFNDLNILGWRALGGYA